MRVRAWQWGGARNALAAGQRIARADGARQRGLARGSRAVGSIRFESAQTHEAVQLPASIADLDATLTKVNGDNLTHFCLFGLVRGELQRLPPIAPKRNYFLRDG